MVSPAVDALIAEASALSVSILEAVCDGSLRTVADQIGRQ